MPLPETDSALCIRKLDAAPSATESNLATTTESDVAHVNVTTSDDTAAATSRCDELGRNCACDHNVGYEINPSSQSIS